MDRKAYPSDVSDKEWAFVAPFQTLMTQAAPQREHSLREVYNELRWLVRTGAAWRMLPHDLPPWYTVYPPTQHWLKAGVFEVLTQDLQMLLRELRERTPTRVRRFWTDTPCN
jgi:transposase